MELWDYRAQDIGIPCGFEDFGDAPTSPKLPAHLVLVMLFQMFWCATGLGSLTCVTAEGSHGCQGGESRAPRGEQGVGEGFAAIPRACALGLQLVYWVHLKVSQII